MSKTNKLRNEDRYYDSAPTPRKQKHSQDHRQNKRLKTALKTRDVDELVDMEDDEQFYQRR